MDLARFDDRVHDVVHPERLRDTSAQDRRVVERAHVGKRLRGRDATRGAHEERLDHRRKLIRLVAGLGQQAFDVERLAACMPTGEFVEQGRELDPHASSHSWSRFLFRLIAWYTAFGFLSTRSAISPGSRPSR